VSGYDAFHSLLLNGMLVALRTLPLPDLERHAAVMASKQDDPSAEFALSAIETVIAEKRAVLHLH
jgi:hypothetical protein